MMHCASGQVTALSQQGLRPEYVDRHYFLPCQCRPSCDMTIDDIDAANLYTSALVASKQILGDDLCRLMLEVERPEQFRGGQFINLHRAEDGVDRSYSVASHPEQDYFIELHIRRMNNGAFSPWIFDELEEQQVIEVQGPLGDCCYQPDHASVPLYLVGGGTGIAPMLGILKEALARDHQGSIHIYHAVQHSHELYLNDELKQLTQQHDRLFYLPCVNAELNDSNSNAEAVLDALRQPSVDLGAGLFYMAGHPQLVTYIFDFLQQGGVDEARLFADPFDMKDLRRRPRVSHTRNDKPASPAARRPEPDGEYPQPDAEMWAALEQGVKLRKILTDFYTIVYDDPRLSPFFAQVTMQRSIDKVYLFIRQIFTGEKVYFGDRPRNAHHWMVISDELFDYRESIMMNTLRDNGLAEHLVQRWRAMERFFRKDIVKQEPWPRIVNGVEMPLDGFEEHVLDCGSICDSCQQPVEVGTRVRYHLRLGKIYCPNCMAHETAANNTSQVSKA